MRSRNSISSIAIKPVCTVSVPNATTTAKRIRRISISAKSPLVAELSDAAFADSSADSRAGIVLVSAGIVRGV